MPLRPFGRQRVSTQPCMQVGFYRTLCTSREMGESRQSSCFAWSGGQTRERRGGRRGRPGRGDRVGTVLGHHSQPGDSVRHVRPGMASWSLCGSCLASHNDLMDGSALSTLRLLRVAVLPRHLIPAKDEMRKGPLAMSPRALATWPLTCPSLQCGPDSHFTGCCPWRPHSRCGRNQSLDLPSPRPPLTVPHGCLLPFLGQHCTSRQSWHWMGTGGSHGRTAPRKALWSSESPFSLPSVWGRVPTMGAAATASSAVPRGTGCRHSQALPCPGTGRPISGFLQNFRNHVIRPLDLMSETLTNPICILTHGGLIFIQKTQPTGVVIKESET